MFEALDLVLCISFIFKSNLGPWNLAAVMLPAPISWYCLQQFISAYWSRDALLCLVTHSTVFHSWDVASICHSKCVCVCALVHVGVCVFYTERSNSYTNNIFSGAGGGGCLPGPCKQILASVDKLTALNLIENCFEDYEIKEASAWRIHDIV